MDSCIQTEEYFSDYVPQLPSLKKCYNVVSVIDYSPDAKRVYPIRYFKSTLQNPTLHSTNLRKKFHRRLGSAGPALPSVKISPKRSTLETSTMNSGRLSVLLALHSPKRSMKSAKYK